MRYEVSQGEESFSVEIRETGSHVYELSVDGGPVVRVDAYKTPRTIYSILIGERQYEGSVDEREDGMLDIHVGTGSFEFQVIDERRKMLASAAPAVATGRQVLRSQMAGRIVRVLVEVGTPVDLDQGLLVIEAMKMENELRSPIEGVVAEVSVAEGDTVETDALLIVIDPPAGA